MPLSMLDIIIPCRSGQGHAWDDLGEGVHVCTKGGEIMTEVPA